MLTVCFDAAGKEHDAAHTVVVVAGFSGFSKQWEDFQREWNERLLRDGLIAFHAGDFAHFTGEFKSGWREKIRREELSGDLMGIIETNGLTRFGSVVPLQVQKGMNQRLMREMRIDAYVHGASCAVSRFNDHAFRNNMRKNLEYVFEKGDSEDALRKRFRDDGYKEPRFTWKQTHTDRKGFTDDGFVGLQASGWIAYEYYLDFTRVLDVSKALPPRRWAMGPFESLPGEIQAQVGFTAANNEEVFRIRQATQYLEGIKNKKR